MSDQPAPTSTANEPDLFDLAAKLAGCQPVDLLKVRRDPAGLVVILATGQKFVFDLASIEPSIEQAIRAQLAAVLASSGLQSGQPAPAPDPAPALVAPTASKKRAR